MPTAEGTRPSLRAAAENEPLSTTARNTLSDSLVKAMWLSVLLMIIVFNYQIYEPKFQSHNNSIWGTAC